MMTGTALRIAVVAGLVVSGASPALAQRREMQQMAADIRILQEQTQLLQNALVSLTDAIKAVNTRIDEQTGTSRKTAADAKLQADAMGGDLRVVRERVDDTNVRITSLSQEVEALRLAIPPMATMMVPATDPAAAGAAGAPGDPGTDTTPPASGAPGIAGTPPPATPPPGGSSLPITAGSPMRLYDTAWADYTAGNFDLAIEGFNSYVRSFPRSESADNAQYYVGQSYFQRGKLAEALDAFNRVISTYPKSDVVGQAYFQRGMTYERLNQADRARESYDYVIKTMGDTDAGRLAKQRLDALNRARPQ